MEREIPSWLTINHDDLSIEISSFDEEPKIL